MGGQAQISAMEETYYCNICLTNKRVSQGFKLQACGHSFCRPCLASYLTSQFKQRQTHPRCFFTDEKGACNKEISVQDIKAVATPEAMEKYVYFSNKEQNPNYVDCPDCKKQQLGDPRHPWTICKYPDCPSNNPKNGSFVGFCFVHQKQHGPDTTCAAYEAKTRQEEKKNRAWQAANTKPCPECGVATEKNEGCNHMTCYVCKTGWCWLCGEIIGNQMLPDHYKSGDCKGKQFTSESVAYMSQWEALCCIMLPAFFFLIFSPIAFIMAIIVCILSPCFYCCVCCSDENSGNRTWNNCVGLFIHILVFAPILLVTLPFWLPCFVYYHCVIAPRRNIVREEVAAAAANREDAALNPLLGAENV
eukprot:CAMPEP_0167789536 /NCGR_PEP_ID=MMETSP0111_2-20121227/10749_1 /TAXON_ID=91324 /ORGANISM="Lotharella globosa, Strain CCCM811" /LENGTH=360 /DNA_ID=CAMNT_0007681733 /DNA_START=206 /DNA_END=1288 /DNA_ORIENTATION=-